MRFDTGREDRTHMTRRLRLATVLMGLVLAIGAPPAFAQAPEPPPDVPPGALAPANLARPRPAAPFDLTGTWQHGRSPQSWRFVPDRFTLTPEAQVHYDAGRRAQEQGLLYRDDIGQCWPAGMPLIMTRVWPIAMIQLPTAIYMISGFMNSLRIIYLDGRTHTDPDIVVRTFNGESIGRWEDDTLVVHTKYFPGHHHWLDQGGAAIPASEDMEIVERIRRIDGGERLQIDYTLWDPKSWEGEWHFTKFFDRQDDVDIQEVQCLPDMNEALGSTSADVQVR
jgi:hypothetical protein